MHALLIRLRKNTELVLVLLRSLSTNHPSARKASCLLVNWLNSELVNWWVGCSLLTSYYSPLTNHQSALAAGVR